MLVSTNHISRRIFESPPRRGFARHLLCDLGKFEVQSDATLRHGCVDPHFIRTLSQWRWHPPPHTYRHEQLPRPLHLVTSAAPRVRRYMEEKLLNMNLDWSCDTFCCPPQSLDMIAYKSLALLQIVTQSATSAQFFLSCTPDPHDVYVLLGVKMFSSGIFSVAAYRRFLQPQGEQLSAQEFSLPVHGSNNIVAILLPRPPQPLLTSSNPLNQCLTLFDDAQEIIQLLNSQPSLDRQDSWQGHNEYSIIDMASELLG